MKSITHRLSLWLSGLLAVVLLLVPFHAFLTIWLASLIGHYTALRLWDDVLIVLGLLLAVWPAWQLRRKLNKTGWWLLGLSAAYVLLHVVIGAVALARHDINKQAFGQGLILNLRLPAVFWLAAVAVSGSDWLKKHWSRLVLIPATLVAMFALLQVTVLPHNFLSHFGYSAQTIVAEETIDHNPHYQRAQSMLRGANPLGAYLVIVIAATAVLATVSRKNNQRLKYGLLGLVALGALFVSYSRSAWMATAAALALVAFCSPMLKRFRPWLLTGGVVVVVVLGLSALTLKHNVGFENTLFHTSQASHSPLSSNAGHVSALRQGLDDVFHRPLGTGPGSAGPASAHNLRPASIAENYYVQIAQEVGLLGLAIFVAINSVLAKLLWQRRRDPLALALLASFVGLIIVNLLSHAWTDDTLALIWWALAGVVLAPAIIKDSRAAAR